MGEEAPSGLGGCGAGCALFAPEFRTFGSFGALEERNGHRPRTLTTKAGDVELRIREATQGLVLPDHPRTRRRIDQALYAVVMEAYVHGVSTRSVDDLVEAMGGTGVSKSEVSRICAGLDETVGAFRTPAP